MEESKRTREAPSSEGETWWWKTTKVDKKQRKAEKADKAAFKGKKGLQTGTGLHLDCNPYNLWEKELDEKGTAKTPLDRFRVFQAQIPLRDQERGDSGLEVIPGFAPWCEMYYKLTDRHGRNLARWGTYNTKLIKKCDKPLIQLAQEIKRIPDNWDPAQYNEKDCRPTGQETMKEVIQKVHQLAREHASLPFTPCLEGDYVLWDFRSPHQNGAQNRTPHNRQTFYHAYLVADKDINGPTLQSQLEVRATGQHPPDFPKKWSQLEVEGYQPYTLSPLGELLYGYKDWKENDDDNKESFEWEEELKKVYPITDRQVAYYRRYGYVVLEDAIPKDLTAQMREETKAFLLKHGMDIEDLNSVTREKWATVSGTMGGMLEIFWSPTMEAIRQHPIPYAITVQFFARTWAKGNEPGFEHPFGALNPRHLWVYIDRQNLRFPRHIAAVLDATEDGDGNKTQ